MLGIDTPESRTRDKEEKKYGLAAKAFLKKVLGTTPILETTKDGKGKFGRILEHSMQPFPKMTIPNVIDLLLM